MKETIEKLFNKLGLGIITSPIAPVSGGFMHRMYKVTACGTEGSRSFAVKHLNPEIMKRPQAQANYARAEKLVLVTNNTREFERVDELQLENWG